MEREDVRVGEEVAEAVPPPPPPPSMPALAEAPDEGLPLPERVLQVVAEGDTVLVAVGRSPEGVAQEVGLCEAVGVEVVVGLLVLPGVRVPRALAVVPEEVVGAGEAQVEGEGDRVPPKRSLGEGEAEAGGEREKQALRVAARGGEGVAQGVAGEEGETEGVTLREEVRLTLGDREGLPLLDALPLVLPLELCDVENVGDREVQWVAVPVPQPGPTRPQLSVGLCEAECEGLEVDVGEAVESPPAAPLRPVEGEGVVEGEEGGEGEGEAEESAEGVERVLGLSVDMGERVGVGEGETLGVLAAEGEVWGVAVPVPEEVWLTERVMGVEEVHMEGEGVKEGLVEVEGVSLADDVVEALGVVVLLTLALLQAVEVEEGVGVALGELAPLPEAPTVSVLFGVSVGKKPGVGVEPALLLALTVPVREYVAKAVDVEVMEAEEVEEMLCKALCVANPAVELTLALPV